MTERDSSIDDFDPFAPTADKQEPSSLVAIRSVQDAKAQEPQVLASIPEPVVSVRSHKSEDVKISTVVSSFIPVGLGAPSLKEFQKCKSLEAFDHHCALNRDFCEAHKATQIKDGVAPLSCQLLVSHYVQFLHDHQDLDRDQEEIDFVKFKKAFVSPWEDLARLEYCRQVHLQERMETTKQEKQMLLDAQLQLHAQQQMIQELQNHIKQQVECMDKSTQTENVVEKRFFFEPLKTIFNTQASDVGF